ncbi:four helix bundle protein [Patescibacteria group bacterium]|nr:four helix bundle protein [Patescibacteria group bacterium]
MHFNELRVYAIATQLEKELFPVIDKLTWRIEQVGQIKRSSSSISANIAEAFGRRFYPKDFIRFLTIALGSSDETQHHLNILYNKKCIDKKAFEFYLNQYKNLSIKILNFINYLRRKNNL